MKQMRVNTNGSVVCKRSIGMKTGYCMGGDMAPSLGAREKFIGPNIRMTFF